MVTCSVHSHAVNKKTFMIQLAHISKKIPCVGLEPTTFGLEVQRAIHCASRAWIQPLIVLSFNELQEQVCVIQYSLYLEYLR